MSNRVTLRIFLPTGEVFKVFHNVRVDGTQNENMPTSLRVYDVDSSKLLVSYTLPQNLIIEYEEVS